MDATRPDVERLMRAIEMLDTPKLALLESYLGELAREPTAAESGVLKELVAVGLEDIKDGATEGFFATIWRRLKQTTTDIHGFVVSMSVRVRWHDQGVDLVIKSLPDNPVHIDRTLRVSHDEIIQLTKWTLSVLAKRRPR